MKILDIISEATATSPLHAAAGAPPQGTTIPATDKWYQKNYEANAKAYERISKGWTGGLYNALRVIGALGPCIWFTASYWALNDIAKLSDAEFTEYTGVSAANKNKWVADSRSMLLGTFTAQYLVYGVYWIGKNLLRFTGILTIVTAGLGLALKNGKAGKLIWGTKIVEQAALAAFVNWLGTPDGQKWMQQNLLVAGILKVEGATLGAIWDTIYEKFFEYTGITKPEPSAVTQAVTAVSEPVKGTLTGDQLEKSLDQFQKNFGR
jgi:hypothetical protein